MDPSPTPQRDGHDEPDSLPDPDDDLLPWEQPWAVRRDSTPHRGEFLLRVAQTAEVVGWLLLAGPVLFVVLDSMDTLHRDWIVFVIVSPVFLMGLLGLATCGLVWLLARVDLGRMRQSVMDATGREITETALTISRRVCVVGLLALGVWIGLVALHLARGS